MADENFDWSHNNRSVIVAAQRELAIYTNHMGQAVIRVTKNEDAGEDRDPFICIDHAQLPKVIEALQAIASAPLNRSAPDDTETE